MTPGTARSRKTVSFGAAVKDNETKPTSKTGISDDCPGKFPSPWTPKEPSKLGETPLRRTALTKTLESVRDTKRRKTEEKQTTTRSVDFDTPQSLRELDVKAGLSGPQIPGSSQQTELQQSKPRPRDLEDFDGDMTLDLNEPHSQSGRYWKSEYERYHEDAKDQMKKLVRYKQLAKSYAKKKDEEAIDLGDKLKEEQQRVLQMEEKVAELVAQIAEGRLNGDQDDSPTMMKDLARQTALAVQYRDQVDQFRNALENRKETNNSEKVMSNDEETNIELKRVKEELHEMNSLRAEMHSLRLHLAMAEKKASRLRDENAKLTRDMAKANEELSQSEKRRQAAESLSRNSVELLESLQKDYNNLKESAKAQRRDAEHLLKKRHDQVSELKKEIATLKDKVLASSTTDKVPFSTSIAGNGNLRRTAILSKERDLMSMEPPSKRRLQTTRPAETNKAAQEVNIAAIEIYEDNLTDSKIPVLGGSTVKPRKSRTDFKESVDESRDPRPKSAALGEIANNKNGPSSLARRHTSDLSLRERFSNLSVDSPKMELPPPVVELDRAKYQRQVAPSPRPSMYNIPSDTPRQAVVRPRSSGTDGAANRAGNMQPSRLSSMASTRSRTTLDPERAAAAKARLEQRNAEKRRTRESREIAKA